ncbi:MAG TPA: erythromycin esterase family protein [Planctomycetota bacterium]|nr:erythromycin esterase family protein [Planctomycetota bacterium]
MRRSAADGSNMRQLVLAIPFLVAARCEPAGAQDDPKEKLAAELRSLSVPVRTIDPTDVDFTDLAPILDRIGAPRVIVLGEATHSDGAVYKAKARLARFLHLSAGFDTLMWEAGFVDCRAMDTALRTQEPARRAAGRMMYGGWDSAVACQPLFEHARASWTSARPLEMAGFDSNRQGAGRASMKDLVQDLLRREPGMIPPEDRPLLDALIDRTISPFSDATAKMPQETRRAQRAALERLIGQAEASRVRLAITLAPNDLEYRLRALRALLWWEEAEFYSSNNVASGGTSDWGRKWNLFRDQRMAEDLLWQLERPFHGHKAMVWAATSHLTRNVGEITSHQKGIDYKGWKQMGQYVADALGPDLYTIAFVSGAGERGTRFEGGNPAQDSVQPNPAPPAGSIEDLCHRTGARHLFLDLRGLPVDHWLRKKQSSVLLGGIVNEADWSRIVDAIFYIDRAEPGILLPL